MTVCNLCDIVFIYFSIFIVFFINVIIDSYQLCLAVIAIKKIQFTYRLHKTNWQGDPCAPVEYKWDGLICSNTNISTSPRIISL